jgi:hypothetical protein
MSIVKPVQSGAEWAGLRRILMRLKWRYSASFLVATEVAAAICFSPIAAADPVWPYAGAESAADTIRDLEEQGYTVAINWVNGYSTGPLSECSVSAINNPDRSADAVPNKSTTVYVDVSCPSDNDWDWGFGIGFGL